MEIGLIDILRNSIFEFAPNFILRKSAVKIVSASVGRVAVRLWNAFGFLDLVAAVTLGTLSATGAPFCVFRQPPGTSVMGTLPWAFVPTVLVPLYILIHLVIESQLRTARIAARAASGPMLSSTI